MLRKEVQEHTRSVWVLLLSIGTGKARGRLAMCLISPSRGVVALVTIVDASQNGRSD